VPRLSFRCAVGNSSGQWGVMEVVGLSVCKHEVGGRAGAKSHETERDGSVLGVPHKNVIGGDGGRWWHCVVEVVVVVVGLCVCKHEVGEGAGGQIPQI
jgi:hypothetical protein